MQMDKRGYAPKALIGFRPQMKFFKGLVTHPAAFACAFGTRCGVGVDNY
jgi:hypothetical protein